MRKQRTSGGSELSLHNTITIPMGMTSITIANSLRMTGIIEVEKNSEKLIRRPSELNNLLIEYYC